MGGNVAVVGGATTAAAAAAAAEWFVHSYSPPVCQLLLDHCSAPIVPGSVVLSKLGAFCSIGLYSCHLLLCSHPFRFDVPQRIKRYKNIIQLWTGCPPSGLRFGEQEENCLFYYPPPPHGQHSWPSFPSHYCSCTQHIVLSHCKHRSPLNQLDYLLYRRRLDTTRVHYRVLVSSMQKQCRAAAPKPKCHAIWKILPAKTLASPSSPYKVAMRSRVKEAKCTHTRTRRRRNNTVYFDISLIGCHKRPVQSPVTGKVEGQGAQVTLQGGAAGQDRRKADAAIWTMMSTVNIISVNTMLQQRLGPPPSNFLESLIPNYHNVTVQLAEKNAEAGARAEDSVVASQHRYSESVHVKSHIHKEMQSGWEDIGANMYDPVDSELCCVTVIS
ncbi:hypothetical protein PAMA_008838 [Pampus argenteus]